MSRPPYRNHDIEPNFHSDFQSTLIHPNLSTSASIVLILKTLKPESEPSRNHKSSLMAENQDDIANLNKLIDEIMRENVEAVEEIQLEPQPGEEINVEQVTQLEEDEQLEKEATEEDKDFISKEAKELWNKILFDKEFVCERGFGKLISPFSEVIEKRGWGFLCEHKAPRFSALAKEFYANMVGMKEDSVYVRGVWVPFEDKRINEMFKLREFKNMLKYKKLIENPN